MNDTKATVNIFVRFGVMVGASYVAYLVAPALLMPVALVTGAWLLIGFFSDNAKCYQRETRVYPNGDKVWEGAGHSVVIQILFLAIGGGGLYFVWQFLGK